MTKEIDALSRAADTEDGGHRNVVRYYGKDEDQFFVYIYMELCDFARLASGALFPCDLSVRVAVQSEDGALLEDIEVVLEDRAWNPGPLGSAITDAEGEGEIDASGVTDLPGCWGTMLDYVLVATDPRGEYATGEKDVNSSLYNAISDGSLEADVRAFPLVLEAVEAR